MALTENQSTLLRDGRQFAYGVKANAAIHQGALVEASGNHVQKAAAGQNKIYPGVALEQATGGAADGDVAVNVRRRCAAKFKVASGRSLGLGATAYVVDDDTVTDQSAGATALGETVAVETDGVWVYIE